MRPARRVEKLGQSRNRRGFALQQLGDECKTGKHGEFGKPPVARHSSFKIRKP
jgi:hypothetical protein